MSDPTSSSLALQKTTPLAGLVLAGGQSTRMGQQNKALVEYHHQPLMHYSLEQSLKEATIRLISCGPKPYTQTRFSHYTQLTDHNHQGPLAGIHQGLHWLTHSQTPTQAHNADSLEWLAVTPCDTPLVPSGWLREALALASTCVPQQPAAKAFYVRHSGRDHYAHSLWHKSSLEIVQAALANQQLALRHVLQKLHAQPLDLTHYCSRRSFTNMNTWQTLQHTQ